MSRPQRKKVGLCKPTAYDNRHLHKLRQYIFYRSAFDQDLILVQKPESDLFFRRDPHDAQLISFFDEKV